MPVKDPLRLTRKESIDRIQEAKLFLGNKERLCLHLSTDYCLPFSYDPLDEISCVSAPRLSSAQRGALREKVLALNAFELVNDPASRVSAIKFIGNGSLSAGSIVQIVFYKWNRFAKDGQEFQPTKVSCLWIGSWHHCPLLFWRTVNNRHTVSFDRLPKYSDLI